MPSFIARCALEWWRASGARTESRLREIVAHFAEINGESDYISYHMQSALSAVHSWEIEP